MIFQLVPYVLCVCHVQIYCEPKDNWMSFVLNRPRGRPGDRQWYPVHSMHMTSWVMTFIWSRIWQLWLAQMNCIYMYERATCLQYFQIMWSTLKCSTKCICRHDPHHKKIWNYSTIIRHQQNIEYLSISNNKINFVNWYEYILSVKQQNNYPIMNIPPFPIY